MADEKPTVTSRRDEAKDEPSRKYPFTYYEPPPEAPEAPRPLTQQDFRREWFQTELAVPEIPWVNPATEGYRQSAKNLIWMEKRYGPLFGGWQGLSDEPFDYRQSAMAYIPEKKIGYSPSYWEDPYRVARNYQAINSMPPGAEVPDWMDKDAITAAYNYFKSANSGKPWTEWKFLNEADPARGFLQGISLPPDEMLLPQEVLYQAPQVKRSRHRLIRSLSKLSLQTQTSRDGTKRCLGCSCQDLLKVVSIGKLHLVRPLLLV